MNAFVPCHSSTPKSVSKPSVKVYHGISQPIRAFTRSMSVCGARETNERVVSRAFRWAKWATWSAKTEQPRHPPPRGGQRVTGAGQLLLFHEQLQARSLPLLRRHDRGCVHGGLLSRVLVQYCHAAALVSEWVVRPRLLTRRPPTCPVNTRRPPKKHKGELTKWQAPARPPAHRRVDIATN